MIDYPPYPAARSSAGPLVPSQPDQSQPDQSEAAEAASPASSTRSGASDAARQEPPGGAVNEQRITPAVLPLLASMPGIGCVVRDEKLSVVWCNASYARFKNLPVTELVGTVMADHKHQRAADERSELLCQVMKTGRAASYYEFASDRRLLCTALACDKASFGHAGVLVMVQEAPAATGLACPDCLPVMSTPCFEQFGVLSPAELRALYFLAQGLSTGDIAERLSRATKTIEKHIESIHRKLGTSSRAALVRRTSERGLQAFEESQWEAIIEGAKAVKRHRR
jgi:DNA-binding CsgD family transcriptional regulator